MTFEYEGPKGEIYELDFKIGQAPSVITVHGINFRRIVSNVQVLIPETFKAHWNDEREINRSLNKELIDNIERKQNQNALQQEAARMAAGG